MFKRVIWMGTGMAVGASGAFWAKRKVTETVERYLPEQVAARAAGSARDLGQTVRAAATEGRAAMRATEAELRARVEARTWVGERPAEDPPEPVPTPAARRNPRPAGGRSTTGPRRRSRR